MNERKIPAIVLEMAPDAIPATRILHPEERVITLVSGEAFGNFLMAIQAFERRRAGSELVASVAFGGALERLVRLRERSRRNLGARACSANEQC